MKWILLILMALIILPGLHYTGFISLFGDSSKESPDLDTSIHSPELKAQNLTDEKEFSLKNLKGQAVLLNFWASWCLPCRKEFPELLEAVQWGEGTLSLVAVSVDSSKEDIKKFLEQLDVKQSLKNPNIHIVWDPEFKTANQFNVVKFPETFILNPDLKIVKKVPGLFFLEKVKPDLVKFLPVREAK